MILTAFLWAAAFIAAFGLVMTVINLAVLRRSAGMVVAGGPAPLISVCIPARNEERNLEECVRSILASTHAPLEVLVYDDQSTDSTPRILSGLLRADQRVKRVQTAPLPEGWNGKQHACHRMAHAAAGEWMLFTDADVRFAPGALSAALDGARARGAGLISAFPRQIVGTIGEALIVPMIFFVLLTYLPFPRMRRTNDAAASAGCGQFLFISRAAYAASGGHEAFKDSMHDGIKLPRAVRRAGLHSDLIDGTPICSCRMYSGFAQSWRGFAKNAYEGLGSVGLLVFITVVHAVAHVLPWIALPLMFAGVIESSIATRLAAGVAMFLAVVQRVLISVRLKHPVWIALAHPVSIALMTAIQWWSLVLHVTGRRGWKGRTLAGASRS